MNSAHLRIVRGKQVCSSVSAAVQGRVIRGEAAVKRSRYPEDVLINNHTSVWGSWWSNGTWGYACCQQTTKNSYCTGEAGLEAAAQMQELMDANLAHKMNQPDPASERSDAKVCISQRCKAVLACLLL